jgi:two-component system sensor histidine kinase DesK
MDANEHARAHGERDIHSSPLGLSYLVFVVFPLLFWQQPPASTWIATAISLACFIPLYLKWMRPGSTYRPWLVPASALIGYALIPFNPGGNTYIIYAMAIAARCLPVRTAIVVSSLLVVAMAAQLFWLMPTMLASASTAVVVVVGTMVVAGTLYAAAHEHKNAQLRLSHAEVRRMAAIAERERIGRDLHDLLGHTLSIVALKSELAGKLLERDPSAAREQIREVEAVARDALAQVREAVTGIRATGLQAEVAAARVSLLSAAVHLDQRMSPVDIEAGTEQALALATREAVTNIIRHAHAGRVELELGADRDGARLVIADDGRGGIEAHGNGLKGMRERLQAIGGHLEVDSPAGGGTRLVMWVPARPAVSP